VAWVTENGGHSQDGGTKHKVHAVEGVHRYNSILNQSRHRRGPCGRGEVGMLRQILGVGDRIEVGLLRSPPTELHGLNASHCLLLPLVMTVSHAPRTYAATTVTSGMT
jgi:hypothetical protein